MKNKLVLLLFTFISLCNFSHSQTQQRLPEPTCEDPITWYKDADGDGYGSNSATIVSCDRPSGYVSNNSDCNDNDYYNSSMTVYPDNDEDGYGDPNFPIEIGCGSFEPGYSPDNSDCDDSNFYLNPDTKWYFDANSNGIIESTETTFILSCDQPGVNYIFSTPNNESLFHWVHEKSYDVFNSSLSESRVYFDDLGKPNLSLSKNFKDNKVWASEKVYDTFGRDLKTSFEAPIQFDSFQKIGLLTSGSNYFSIPTLTKYYSNSNSIEPYQAIATHPYGEVEYDKLNPANVIKSFGGNQIAGEWKSGYSYTVPAAQEMYYVFGYNYFEGVYIPFTNKEIIETKFNKTVVVDANGVENVVFSDGEGKTLATAKSGGSNLYQVYSLIGTQGYVDVHIPSGVGMTAGTIFGFATTSLYKVFNLKTGLEITPTPTTLAPGLAYRVVANTPPSANPNMFVTNVSGGSTLSYDPLALGVNYKVNYYDYSINVYDKTGRLKKTVQPKGYAQTFPSTVVIKDAPAYMLSTATDYISTFTYNALGQVIESKSPDEGTSKFAYRNDGQIRFSQNQLQASSDKVSYSNYDSYGRVIESGILNDVLWSDALSNVNNPISVLTDSGATCSEQTFSVYDFDGNYQGVAPPIIDFNGFGLNPITYKRNNLAGNVVATYNDYSSSWYSYDIYNRIEWMVQNINGAGIKTIHYEYDYKGNVTNVIYQKDVTEEYFAHEYTYDINSVLTSVKTKKTPTAASVTHADYSYYATGELKRINIPGVQGIDYVYTLSGMLKSINHPSLEQLKDPGLDTNDAFGITLDYYSGDYTRAGTNVLTSSSITPDYTGNIRASRFATKAIDWSGTTANQKAYMYNYDRNSFLTSAKFGTTNNTASIATATSPNLGQRYEGSMTYDANGNLLTLIRTDNTDTAGDGTQVDNFDYAYTNGKNQLATITDTGITTPFNASDIEGTSNYVYNSIGQLIQNGTLHYEYNAQGLVSEVRNGINPIVKFNYNERGQRIVKESYATSGSYELLSATYYILDVSGNLISSYYITAYDDIVQKELPIYGLSRLGVYSKGSGAAPDVASYEITDHLGNVRVVIKKEIGGSVITPNFFADYYPFGELLPGRSTLLNNYRYAFQGQELDGETGMETFQLRLWDGRIGRWLSPDPAGQFDSPYLGMGNNPINGIDPDGAFWEELGNWLSGNGWKTNSQRYTKITTNNVASYSGPTYGVEEGGSANFQYYDSKNSYSLVHPTTVLVQNRSDFTDRHYESLYPRDLGSWNETGSDGYYWIGCLACHADNGGYRYGAYNSREGKNGIAGSMILNYFASRLLRVPMTKNVMDPNEIHFMQSTIKNATGEFTVIGNAEALANGSLNPDVLRMNVWKDATGKVWTLDHRRLAAFRLSGLKKAPIQWTNPSGQMWKMTTRNGGKSIKLKIGDGNSKIVK